jgi:ubiquinone/menaquinone biosynthesis C-methylase UbiE
VAAHLKFDMAKLERLNDPGRFETLPPDLMWDALGRPDPERIVEIGAGTGVFSAAFTSLAPKATVWAADIEDTMIDWMRANRPEVALGRIVPIKAEETKIPLPDTWADLVVMINLHHELAEPEESYAEALRLLKPGGRLLVVDWAARETPKGPPQSVRATAEDIAEILIRVGFSAVEDHDVLVWHTMLTARA